MYKIKIHYDSESYIRGQKKENDKHVCSFSLFVS